MTEKNKKIYYRGDDPEINTKLKIFMKNEGYPNSKFLLVDNSDGKGVHVARFNCGECSYCKKGEICDIEDDPPTQEELDSINLTLFTKSAIENQKKEEDIFLQKLKKYLKPDVFL